MRISQVFADNSDIALRDQLKAVGLECSTFLQESRGTPVYKRLPNTYEDVRRVKVRKHKRNTAFANTFNEAFDDEIKDLRQRSIFASGVEPVDTDDKEAFFIFPINGFKYMYSPEVQHSTDDYKQVFESIFENIEDPEEIIRDLLKFSYIKTNLYEGITRDAELIFYNIPYYYCVRAALYESYDDLLIDLGVLGET